MSDHDWRRQSFPTFPSLKNLERGVDKTIYLHANAYMRTLYQDVCQCRNARMRVKKQQHSGYRLSRAYTLIKFTQRPKG